MSIIQSTYQPYVKNEGIFDVILDIEITLPSSFSGARTLFIDKLYKTEKGISVVVTDSADTIVACLYDCTTYGTPVAMSTELDSGISAHILLADCAVTGNLIDLPVPISPDKISTSRTVTSNSCSLTLVVDGNTIYSELLTSDKNLSVSGILKVVDVVDGVIEITCDESAGAIYSTAAQLPNKPLSSINRVPFSGGTAYIYLDTDMSYCDPTRSRCNILGCTMSGCTNTTPAIKLFGDHIGISGTTAHKVAYVDTVNLNERLKPVDLIDKYVYVNLPDKEYQYLPLDNFYVGGTFNINTDVATTPDPIFDDVNNV